jgi:uncharacterized caspase-like protein
VRAIFLVVLLCFLTARAHADFEEPTSHRHVALVVGSSAYQGAQPLPNVAAETFAVAQRLRVLGYRVFYLRDPTRQELLRALAELRIAASSAQQVVIYLAGHGYTFGGEAYYVPIDALPRGGHGLIQQAVPLMLFSRAVSDQPRQKIIFFDACRTEIISEIVVPGPPKLPWQAGLAVVFASAPGTEAYDGRLGQSPFAAAFLRHVTDQSPPLEAVAKRIRRDVVRQTQGAQVPWLQSALLSEAYLRAQ